MGNNFINKLSFLGFLLCFSIISLPSCGDDDTPVGECDGSDPSYMTDIEPIITTTCAITDCHVAGFQSGDFTTYAGLKAKVDNGTVTDRAIDMQNMPPEGSAGPDLTAAQILILKCWIADGAPNN